MSRRTKAPSPKSGLPRWAGDFDKNGLIVDNHGNSPENVFNQLADIVDLSGAACRRAIEFYDEETRDDMHRAFELGQKIGFVLGCAGGNLANIGAIEHYAAKTKALARVNRATATVKRSKSGKEYVSTPVTDEERASVAKLDRELSPSIGKPYARAREIAARLDLKQRRVEYLMGLRR